MRANLYFMTFLWTVYQSEAGILGMENARVSLVWQGAAGLTP